jgi:hypothetical protein
MKFRSLVITSIILINSVGSTFAIDYSRYKYEQFTIPKSNPAYLVTPGGQASAYSLVKTDDNKWVVPVGPFWYVTLSQALIEKILSAKNNGDNFILFYQRRGNYVDISKYTGTTDPDLIRSDNKGQMDYIAATAKTYTFVADDVLTYSEIMTGIPENMRRILLEEENRGNDYNDEIRNPIFLAFVNGQMDGARNYIANRIKAIEAVNAEAQAKREDEARRIAAEEQKRQDERRAVEARANTLKNAIIMGYKPCFNIEGSNNETPYAPFQKIAVIGYLQNGHNREYSIRPINFNNNQRGILSLAETATLTNLFPSISDKPRYGGYGDNTTESYYCIFFLTQTNKNNISYYILDHYLFLGDIVNKTKESAGRADVKQTLLEDWILTNNGKQDIPLLNTVAVTDGTTRKEQPNSSPSTTATVIQDMSSAKEFIQEPARRDAITKRTINGYEPCFNIGGTPEPTPYREFSKIIVVGYFYNSYNNNFQIRTYNYNRNQKENIKLAVSQENKNVFNKIVRQGYTDTSYFCIFFLSKLATGDYKIDSFTDYGEIIEKDKNGVFANDVSKSALEGWITQNHDR